MNKSIAFLCLISCSAVYAQHTVTGEVLDDRTLKPLPGITVSAEHAAIVAVTDRYGRFSFSLASPQTVITASGSTYESAITEVKLPLTAPLKIFMVSILKLKL